MPEYRDRTTLLVTTDHGRGATLKDWMDHGKDVPAAEDTWIAALGPAARALGPRENLTVTSSQFAATIASVVGEDFRQATPRAAPPLPLREEVAVKPEKGPAPSLEISERKTVRDFRLPKRRP